MKKASGIRFSVLAFRYPHHPTMGASVSKPEVQRFIITVIVLVIFAGTLLFVLLNFNAAPVTDKDGAPITQPGEFLKTVLAGVLALATLVVGNLIGASGKEKAQEQAESAQADATEAKLAVAALIPNTPDGQLTDARNRFPKAFL
jgi:ABC-type xylose transport system permease subunit